MSTTKNGQLAPQEFEVYPTAIHKKKSIGHITIEISWGAPVYHDDNQNNIGLTEIPLANVNENTSNKNSLINNDSDDDDNNNNQNNDDDPLSALVSVSSPQKKRNSNQKNKKKKKGIFKCY